MNRPTALITQESYHVYNRGAHKNAIFLGPEDYERFLLLLIRASVQFVLISRLIHTPYCIAYDPRRLILIHAQNSPTAWLRG